MDRALDDIIGDRQVGLVLELTRSIELSFLRRADCAP